MQVLCPRCCGLDIHKKFVVACMLTTGDNGGVQNHFRTFSTMTHDILVILHWLQEEEAAVELLDTVPGISQRGAEILLAEIGTDLSRFPSAKHLASWAGMCPGNKESGGKRLSGKTRKANPWLRQVSIKIAHVASKTKDTYLAAQYQRIAARRGKKRALVALGHTILIIVYHIMARREPYRECRAAPGTPPGALRLCG